MKKQKQWLKTGTVLLTMLMALTLLAGCGSSGTPAPAEQEAPAPVQADAPQEAAEGTEQEQAEGTAEVQTGGTLTLNYASTDDNPTITNLVFDFDTGKVAVDTSVASGLYLMTYETEFTVEDGKLVLTDCEGTANGDGAVCKLLGLPTELTAMCVHTYENGVLTVRFGEPENMDEATLLAEITLTPEDLAAFGL